MPPSADNPGRLRRNLEESAESRNAEAVVFVTDLYDQFGFDTVNIGPLSESSRARTSRSRTACPERWHLTARTCSACGPSPCVWAYTFRVLFAESARGVQEVIVGAFCADDRG